MKLHLGCGKRFIPGWVHVDVVDYPHIDLRHSIDDLPMIASGTVHTIYACHVLEHFFLQAVPRILKEWWRVLEPGGLLRVAVPDFEQLAANYLEHHDLEIVRGSLMGRGDHLYNIHHTVFDLPTLAKALVAAGFVGVRRYDWCETEHASLDDYSQAYYPHMSRGGQLLSLNVEADKEKVDRLADDR